MFEQLYAQFNPWQGGGLGQQTGHSQGINPQASGFGNVGTYGGANPSFGNVGNYPSIDPLTALYLHQLTQHQNVGGISPFTQGAQQQIPFAQTPGLQYGQSPWGNLQSQTPWSMQQQGTPYGQGFGQQGFGQQGFGQQQLGQQFSPYGHIPGYGQGTQFGQLSPFQQSPQYGQSQQAYGVPYGQGSYGVPYGQGSQFAQIHPQQLAQLQALLSSQQNPQLMSQQWGHNPFAQFGQQQPQHQFGSSQGNWPGQTFGRGIGFAGQQFQSPYQTGMYGYGTGQF
jgi:hypothetical protein